MAQQDSRRFRALHDAVVSADTEKQILSSVARIAWFYEHGDEECPPSMIPDAEALAVWWESDRLLMDVLDASKEATQTLVTLLDAQNAFWVSHGRFVVAVVPGRDDFRSSATEAETLTIEQVHEIWLAKRELNTGHPLRPVIGAWHRRPVRTMPNTRTNRLMPSRVAMVQGGDARALPRVDRPGLFSPAAHLENDQMSLPGFGQVRQSNLPALPLALYDLGMEGAPSRGAAPLALRLWVEAILSVGLDERMRNRPVEMEVSLRTMRERLWPNSWNGYSSTRLRRVLHQAADALDSWEAAWPWHDPDTGRGGSRRIVLVSDIGNNLDDTFRLVVDLPPGSAEGPQVSATLAAWGAKSADAYRSLLNLAYTWHQPGRTHMPLAGGHWVRRTTPDAYPELSDDDLLALVFPTHESTATYRKELLYRARKTLEMLSDAGELQLHGRRVLPPKGGS